MKASPLLRAWLGRLEAQGVMILTRHRWRGFEATVRFRNAEWKQPSSTAMRRLLALGGASWPRLGSDAAWAPLARRQGRRHRRPSTPPIAASTSTGAIPSATVSPAQPLKSVTATSDAGTFPGEFVITRHGIEGSLVYAHAAALRDRLDDGGPHPPIDLAPGRSTERLAKDLARQDRKASLSNRLRKGAGLEGVKTALLRELAPETALNDPHELARSHQIPADPVRPPRAIAEAISSAGGIRLDDLDDRYMLKSFPASSPREKCSTGKRRPAAIC